MSLQTKNAFKLTGIFLEAARHMGHDFDYKADRLARDLNVGNEQDAANILRQEIYGRNPCRTEALIDRAYQLSSPYRRADILQSPGGNVSVRDNYTGYTAHAGRIPNYCDRDQYPYPGPRPIPIPIPIPIPFPFPRGGQPPHDRHPHPRPDRPHPRHDNPRRR